jgi:hypothetical protein
MCDMVGSFDWECYRKYEKYVHFVCTRFPRGGSLISGNGVQKISIAERASVQILMCPCVVVEMIFVENIEIFVSHFYNGTTGMV